ncbi:MAG: endonuclease/exonuclease/phosphatase family protein [Prevotellaceae bacterium]|jgi:endonuclease/exonuclease/phosphatase family metal-dependent hydrolase|nr:endonuclease/exonuclease/phosphatase family protein [Prevotellaceae bacterium]
MGTTELKSIGRAIPVLLTWVLGLITVAASFAGRYDPATSFYMPALGLLIPVLLLMNLLVLVCWLFGRRRRWAVVSLVAILCNWNFVAAVFQINFTDGIPATHATSTTPDGYLKVATYNVQGFGSEITGYSAKKLAAYLRDQGTDILCFQEFAANQYYPMDSLRRVFAHWEYALLSGDSLKGTLPIALFSRYPLTGARFIRYDGSVNCSLQCDVVLGTDTLRLLNNHLQTTAFNQNKRRWAREMATDDTRREARAVQSAIGTLHDNFLKRARQTRELCRLVEESRYPVVLCGDLNSLPDSYTYRQLHALLEDGFRTAGQGYMYTYRYFKRLMRIDYIFHSASLEGCRYYSPNMELCSDHNPVLMELKYR